MRDIKRELEDRIVENHQLRKRLDRLSSTVHDAIHELEKCSAIPAIQDVQHALKEAMQ